MLHFYMLKQSKKNIYFLRNCEVESTAPYRSFPTIQNKVHTEECGKTHTHIHTHTHNKHTQRSTMAHMTHSPFCPSPTVFMEASSRELFHQSRDSVPLALCPVALDLRFQAIHRQGQPRRHPAELPRSLRHPRTDCPLSHSRPR